MTVATLERAFPPDMRCVEGHFPGNPIIPGAVVLSETLRAIENNLALLLSPCQIRTAKFFHPARPGDRMAIEYSVLKPGEIRFTCTVEDKKVLGGVVACAALPARA